MTGILRLADSIKAELEQFLPEQRKTQRGKLSLLVATMLDARSANLMDRRCRWKPTAQTCAISGSPAFSPILWSIPTRSWRRSPGRFWNARPMATNPDPGPVEDLGSSSVLAVRFGERALPLAWRVEAAPSASKPRRRFWTR
jgi:hypothetical protein